MSEHEHAACGCREYHELSRRNFIVGTAGATVFGAILPAWLPKVVLARSEVSSRDIIVNIFQRGGADGLSLVAPFADANYYTARPALAIPRPDSGDANRGTALDNTFQFPRPMLGLLPAYQAGELLCVHGAGLAYSSRSHFDAQRFIEVGKAADLTITTGWLGRHLATTEAMRPGATLRGLAMSSGLPTDLTGGPKTLPIPDPATYAIGGSATTRDARADWLATDFFLDQEPARSSALDATATLALLRSINFTGYAPSNGAVYPNNGFGRSLRSAAALIKADIGVEAIQIDIGGWDTHVQQDPLAGAMYNLMLTFGNAVGAFWADVLQGNGNYNVTLVAMSEFGRNVRQNGSAGTDHGRGGVMFVMGHQITGGRVLTNNWLPLARENQQDGQDVRVTIDHRDILAEVVRNRLGNANLDLIWPGYTATMRGVTR
ncbi:MAG TPA: DUF1501 domain-containing protein [Gemmatimonadaceae bacterium]|nr:DUF1501 domain-containing protein [Gemmatimonadaceae bacterium]